MEEEERQGPSNPTCCAGDYSTPTPAGFSLDLHLPLHFEIAFFQPVRISRILKNDGIHPASQVKSRKVRLKKGPQKIRLDYFEGAGQEELYLAWSGDKFSETPLSKWLHPARFARLVGDFLNEADTQP